MLIEGRRVGIDDLQPGTRIAIHLDSTNSVIQDIRALERPEKVAVIKRASDLAHLDPPSEARVLRALPPVPRSVPGILEVFRDNIQIVAERIVTIVDSPRHYPLVGEAELIHCHWKFTVYFTENVKYSYPFPGSTARPAVEIVYIDKDYLRPTK